MDIILTPSMTHVCYSLTRPHLRYGQQWSTFDI